MWFVSVAIVALALVGCSPYHFGEEVGSLSDSVQQTRAGLDEGYANLRSDILSRQNAEFEGTRARVELSQGCGRRNVRNAQGQLLDPCTLVRSGTPDPTVPTVFQIEDAARAKVNALARYVAAMYALTDAADRQALEAATGQLAGAASALTMAVGTPQAIAAAPVVAAVVQAGGTLAAIALDYERVRTLRRTVEATDPHIRTVATSLGANLDMLRIARLEQILSEVNFQAERLAPSLGTRYAAALETTQHRLAAANALREADAVGVGQKISDAHSKLLVAVNDRSRGAGELAMALRQLADAARTLREALVEQASAAGAPSTQAAARN